MIPVLLGIAFAVLYTFCREGGTRRPAYRKAVEDAFRVAAQKSHTADWGLFIVPMVVIVILLWAGG